MKKILSYLSLGLFIIGIVGFIFNFLIGSGAISVDMELPLFGIQGVVEKNNKIYIGLGFYNRIQIYDLNGKYIGYRKTKNYSNDFNFKIDSNGNPYTEREFSRNIVPSSFLDSNWVLYETDRQIPKRIICYTHNSPKVIIQQSFFKSLWSGPFCPWLIGVFGLIVFFLTNIYKVIEIFYLKEDYQTKLKKLFRDTFQ